MLDFPRTSDPIRMRRALTLVSIGAAVWLAVPTAQAIGFGRIGNPTLLGQPLDFSAIVRLDNDEALEHRCVSAEVLSGENRVGADQVRVELRRGTDASERIVRVTTRHMIDEPVVTVVVTVGCTSRVTRRFVAFLDPPVLNLARASEEPLRTDDPVRVDSQVAPLLALVQSAPPGQASPATSGPRSAATRTRSRPRAAPSQRVAQAGPHETTLDAPRRPPRRIASASGTVARARSPGPRLQLEAAAPVVARAPERAASAVDLKVAAATSSTDKAIAPVSAADAESRVLQEALALERARIQALETGLAHLRTEGEATRRAMTELQGRLRQAESERYANPLVYALGALCALLAVAAWFARRQGPRRGNARWWDLTQLPAVEPAAAAPAVDVAPEPETANDTPWVYKPARLSPADADREGPASSIGGLEVTTVIDHALLARMTQQQPAANGPLDLDIDQAPRALSVDGLIDLEQQVEFFALLGKDDEAVDILSRATRDDDNASPLVYFELMKVHRGRGEEAAFARVGEAFHQRFGAVAPAWDEFLETTRSLEQQPRFFGRLQAAWSRPEDAMALIETALFRREPADEMPDLAMCRQLVLLYSTARDLAEHAAAGDDGGVDFLLPIEEATEDSMATIGTPSHFAALYTLPTRPAPLDLDISMPAALDDSELRKAV